MLKAKRRKGSTKRLRQYHGNKRYIRGKLFELAVNELVGKAGFVRDVVTDQLTVTKTKMHGRGAAHQTDVVGRFQLGVPFVYPLLLVGEAKAYGGRVGLKDARNFLGLIVDITQFHRIDTRRRSDDRYKDIFRPRFTYCPAFFSMNGFAKRAEGFLYAHGIFPVSFENNQPMERLRRHIEVVLKRINYSRILPTDFPRFRDLRGLADLRVELKKRGFDVSLQRLLRYLGSLRSYIGILDQRFPVSIVTTRKRLPRSGSEISLQVVRGGALRITHASRDIAQFSLTMAFLRSYAQVARTTNQGLSSLDIVVPNPTALEIRHYRISGHSRGELLGNGPSASA